MKRTFLAMLVITLLFTGCFGFGKITMPVESDVYKMYDEVEFNAIEDKSQTALFFFLKGCGICVSKEKDIIRNLDDFPEGSTVYKVNFRSEGALKKEYGVRAQDTIVTFDNEGNSQARLGLPASKIIETFEENMKEEVIFEEIFEEENNSDEAVLEEEASPQEQALRILGVDTLVAYEGSEFENAPDKSKVALFFSADWCGTCQTKKEDILTMEFPNGAKIYQVDFDTAFDLRKKYGVTLQDTFITFDEDENPVKVVGMSIDDLYETLAS